MSRYAARRMQTKNVAFAFVVALVASLLIWTPSWQNPWAVASGDLGYDSEVDFYGDFNGTSSAAEYSGRVIPAGSFTIESWASVSGQASDWQAVISQNQRPAADTGFFFGISSGSEPFIHVAWSDGTNWLNSDCNTAAGSVPVGTWFHMATVFDGTSFTTYINGQLVKVCSGSSPIFREAYDGFKVGGRTDGGQFLDGRIDQVKIWSSALNAEEIASSMHTHAAPSGVAGLIAHYDFNEGSGSTIFDRVGAKDLTATSVGFEDVKAVTTADDGDIIVPFPRTYLPGVGGWTVPDGVASVEYLLVGGGGGGAARNGAGGGAGEVISSSAYPLVQGATYSIQIGQGGLGGPASYTSETRRGTNGQPTTLLKSGSGVTAEGGNRAGSAESGDASVINGGQSGNGYLGGVGLSDNGCTNGLSTKWCAGGGAGAGGDGSDASGSAGGYGGNGGPGLQSSITGTSVIYGGGGGGGTDANVPAGSGGSGGGGDGS